MKIHWPWDPKATRNDGADMPFWAAGNSTSPCSNRPKSTASPFFGDTTNIATSYQAMMWDLGMSLVPSKNIWYLQAGQNVNQIWAGLKPINGRSQWSAHR